MVGNKKNSVTKESDQWVGKHENITAPSLEGPNIPNHFSAPLSELDLQMALAVPPGGNWKDIPDTVPSKRVQGIRRSYAAGGGSRSTYYGRLRSDAPSYTINTHFSRPGNGCHLHYDYRGGQHRVLSQREAARLQSFPDSFVFHGSKTAINKQIGNAVPPLLAYQLAQCFPRHGQFVDLFCGAGGLSLGFQWAGWEPIVANDIEESFLKSYRANVHNSVIQGDIRDSAVFDEVIRSTQDGRERHRDTPLVLFGGPPCQGFSTAGNRRSMTDERNQLFYQFSEMIEALHPNAFVFENVPGLLNMKGGRVFELISEELKSRANELLVWKLQSEHYGVPQRRTRLFLIGILDPKLEVSELSQITVFGVQDELFDRRAPAIKVGEALSDLPPLKTGRRRL